MPKELDLLDGRWGVFESHGFRYLGHILEENPSDPETPQDGCYPLWPVYELVWVHTPAEGHPGQVVNRMIALPDLLLGVGIPMRIPKASMRRMLVEELLKATDAGVFRELVSQAEGYKEQLRAARAGIVKG